MTIGLFVGFFSSFKWGAKRLGQAVSNLLFWLWSCSIWFDSSLEMFFFSCSCEPNLIMPLHTRCFAGPCNNDNCDKKISCWQVKVAPIATQFCTCQHTCHIIFHVEQVEHLSAITISQLRGYRTSWNPKTDFPVFFSTQCDKRNCLQGSVLRLLRN